jgi:ABC-type dipeptide/oligopeptide/nickel transport system ATPase component
MVFQGAMNALNPVQTIGSQLVVTHDLPVVAQVCERAAVMYAGEIVEAGPVRSLYLQPRHPYTRLLFASTPDLHGGRAACLLV